MESYETQGSSSCRGKVVLRVRYFRALQQPKKKVMFPETPYEGLPIE